MDERSELFSLESASSFLKKNLLLVILMLGGSIMLIFGGLQFFSQSDNSQIEFVSGENKSEASKIFIDISGAVKNPGVFEFSSTDRISDAIKSAGGLTDDANTEFISKNINQSQNLADGMKLYIPFEGEEVSNVLGESDTTQGNALINLNSSTQSTLEDLPKIGPVTAEKIISGRPYDTVNDLLIRKVVGSSVFNEIKDLVTAP